MHGISSTFYFPCILLLHLISSLLISSHLCLFFIVSFANLKISMWRLFFLTMKIDEKILQRMPNLNSFLLHTNNPHGPNRLLPGTALSPYRPSLPTYSYDHGHSPSGGHPIKLNGATQLSYYATNRRRDANKQYKRYKISCQINTH